MQVPTDKEIEFLIIVPIGAKILEKDKHLKKSVREAMSQLEAQPRLFHVRIIGPEPLLRLLRATESGVSDDVQSPHRAVRTLLLRGVSAMLEESNGEDK